MEALFSCLSCVVENDPHCSFTSPNVIFFFPLQISDEAVKDIRSLVTER